MIRDLASELSTAQSVAVNATTVTSTNYLDTEVVGGDVAVGSELRAVFEMSTTMSAGTSITFQLFTDSATGFGSETKVYDSGAIARATLVKGYRIPVKLPFGLKRYLRAKYVVAGDNSAGTGAVTAGIVKEVAQWKAAPAVGSTY